MAILRDEEGNPKPQYETATPNVFEAAKGSGGNIHTEVKSSALPVGAATEAKQDTLNAKDFATQTTLAAILAKIIAAPATEATLSAVAGYVDGIEAILTAIRDTSGIKKITDPLPAGTNNIGDVDVLSSVLPTGAATSAKQDILNAKDFATQATSAAILAKLIAAPATEAKQDTLIAKDYATQATLAALLAKIIAAPATEAKQDSIITYIDGLETLLTAIKDTDGIKKIASALPAGTNILGKMGIDQTTPGTTNAIQKKVRMLESTIMNAVTVGASGNSALTSLGTDGTESEVWIAIAIDKQPWGLAAGNLWGNYGAANSYPQYWNKPNVYNPTNPALSLILGRDFAGANYPEAKSASLPLPSGSSIVIYNQQAVDPATVTVKVYRVWR